MNIINLCKDSNFGYVVRINKNLSCKKTTFGKFEEILTKTIDKDSGQLDGKSWIDNNNPQ